MVALRRGPSGRVTPPKGLGHLDDWKKHSLHRSTWKLLFQGTRIKNKFLKPELLSNVTVISVCFSSEETVQGHRGVTDILLEGFLCLNGRWTLTSFLRSWIHGRNRADSQISHCWVSLEFPVTRKSASNLRATTGVRKHAGQHPWIYGTSGSWPAGFAAIGSGVHGFNPIVWFNWKQLCVLTAENSMPAQCWWKPSHVNKRKNTKRYFYLFLFPKISKPLAEITQNKTRERLHFSHLIVIEKDSAFYHQNSHLFLVSSYFWFPVWDLFMQ